MIIDAHMHLTVERGGLDEKRDALFLSMREDGAEKGVIIADSWLESPIGTNEQCLALFDGDDRIRVVAGISPLIDYERRLKLLEGWLREKRAAGIKLYCGHENVYIDDASLSQVYDLAAEYGVPVLFHSGWDNAHYAEPERVLRAAAARPEVTLVCCHCFYPEIERCFDTLRDVPNVMFDTSSVADSEKYLDRFRPVLEREISLLPERFVFGSDYNGCSRRAHMDFFSSLSLSEAAREKLFSGNAQRLYGF